MVPDQAKVGFTCSAFEVEPKINCSSFRSQMEELKNKGNTAFSAGDFKTAVELFTSGIALDPTNHVLYSNRSAAYASLKQYQEALVDADKTIQIQPSWGKVFAILIERTTPANLDHDRAMVAEGLLSLGLVMPKMLRKHTRKGLNMTLIMLN